MIRLRTVKGVPVKPDNWREIVAARRANLPLPAPAYPTSVERFQRREANASGPQTEEWHDNGGKNPYARTSTPRFNGKLQRKAGDDKAQAKALATRDAFIAFMESVFAECRRVLKPGAYGLVWAIPKTSHWTATALENVGFEKVDVIAHLFGQGFPKSLDISKALAAKDSPEAAKWGGWGTALKPAREDWILVRKPPAGTYAANVLRHGVGGMNVEGCRVEFQSDADKGAAVPQGRATAKSGALAGGSENDNDRDDFEVKQSDAGRWPPNVVLSHSPDCVRAGTREVASNGHYPAARPAGSDVSGPSGHVGQAGLEERHTRGEVIETWTCAPGCPVAALDAQSTSTSRFFPIFQPDAQDFFYTGKAPNREKWRIIRCSDRGGCGFIGAPMPLDDAREAFGTKFERLPPCPKCGAVQTAEAHPTPKSLKLMRWLCRLVTPPGGVVLDPFFGTGSTGHAALDEGFRVIGIEQEEGYARIAAERLSRHDGQPDTETEESA